MENKKSFILYCDLIHTIKKLPDEEAGKLFKHILSYVNDENPTTDNLILNIAFEPIKQQLKRDLKQWESERNARSEAGKKGMESKWGKNDYILKRSQRLSEARKKGTHTKEQWNELLNLCDYKCVKCQSDINIVKDHIIPIYQGGSDSIDNLQPLCKICNSSKGADSTNYKEIYLKTPNKSLTMPNKSLTMPNKNNTSLTNITDTVTVNVNDNEIKRKKFCDSIFDYFEIAENIQPLNIQKLHLFYSTLLKENKIELFLNQFKKYKKYRIDSKNKYRFSLDNFIKEAWFASSWETKINLTASEMCIDNLPAKYRDLIGLSFNTLKIRQFDDPEKEKWSRWMYKEREKNGITKGNYYGIQ